MTATQVLDLAGREPVRRRFRFDDDDLARLEEWVGGAGVRWGFDAAHRAPFKLEGIGANTWRAGLDRILLGVTMADERQRLFGGALPLDDVDSGDIELAGRVGRVPGPPRATRSTLWPRRAPSTAGPTTLARIADALTATTEQDAWQRAQLQRAARRPGRGGHAADTVSPVELGCDDVRSLLADRLQGRPTRANFRTGHLTICTLVPMRSVPHRVVCLLGLDDGSFPRHIERDGDDLTAANPRSATATPAARTASSCSTPSWRRRPPRHHLHGPRRAHQPRPPARRAGRRAARRGRPHRADRRRDRARDAVVVHHPLQPFDVRNFKPGRSSPDGRGASTRSTSTAPALRRAAEAAAPFLARPLARRRLETGRARPARALPAPPGARLPA